eukprot:gb/GEZN01019568.1/.p1 GENE.gb/GEZN01019568.1/~~gb/GEZN01019568.1/.p1  ORF type:complete len:166 (-),score=17.10 gb/GEZN01019568.1/:27-524(-)
MYTVFALGLGIGLGIGVLLSTYSVVRAQGKKEGEPAVGETEQNLDTGRGAMKMVLAVRTDLKMGKGKIGAQCGHAAVGAVQMALKLRPNVLRAWERHGATKIAVKVADEEEMVSLDRAARAVGLLTYMVHDAGRTQIAPNSKTVLAIGPGPVQLVDGVAKHLKLL